jgi:hypothetical protein
MSYGIQYVSTDVGPEDNPNITNWYTGYTKMGPRFNADKKFAMQFDTKDRAHNVLNMDERLQGGKVVEL